jgi:hypothetical protein
MILQFHFQTGSSSDYNRRTTRRQTTLHLNPKDYWINVNLLYFQTLKLELSRLPWLDIERYNPLLG